MLGSHPEFVDRLAALEWERNNAIKRAELYRDYQIDCANRLYEKDREQAVEEYMVNQIKIYYLISYI